MILKKQKRELLVIKAVCLEMMLVLKAFTLTSGVFSIFGSTDVKFHLIFKSSHFVFLPFVKPNIKAICFKKNVIWIASGSLMCDARPLELVLCDSLEAWDGKGGGNRVQERGDTWMPVAGSC